VSYDTDHGISSHTGASASDSVRTLGLFRTSRQTSVRMADKPILDIDSAGGGISMPATIPGTEPTRSSDFGAGEHQINSARIYNQVVSTCWTEFVFYNGEDVVISKTGRLNIGIFLFPIGRHAGFEIKGRGDKRLGRTTGIVIVAIEIIPVTSTKIHTEKN